MSYQATTWAVMQRTGSPGHKAVLLALANRAGVETWACFPSVGTIAEETEQGARTVIRQLGDLERLGLIRREPRYRDGRRTTNRITLYPQAQGSQVPDWHVEAASKVPNNGVLDATGGGAEQVLQEQVTLTSTDVFNSEAPAAADFSVNVSEPPWVKADMPLGAWLRTQQEEPQSGAESAVGRETVSDTSAVSETVTAKLSER